MSDSSQPIDQQAPAKLALLPMTAAFGVIGEGSVVGAAFMAELIVMPLRVLA